MVASKMAMVLTLTLLGLLAALSVSLPTETPGSPEVSSLLDTPAIQELALPVDGPAEDADKVGDDADSEPIALLIGKDVKRVIRRKGNHKVSKHRGQHQTLRDLAGSHEWFPQASELNHILNPVSLEEPEDIELKKAIAKLLKEVEDREEKRKKKLNLKSHEGELTIFNGDEPQKVQSKSGDHHDEVKSLEDNFSDDGIDESFDEVVDHQDNASDAIDYTDSADYHSGSGDEYGDSNFSNDDLVSTENDYDYIDDTVHEVKINPKKRNHGDDQHKNRRKGQHNVHDDPKNKISHHEKHHIHVSKELIKEEGKSKNYNKNKPHHDDSNSITLETSHLIDGKQTLTHVDDNHDDRNENDDNESLASKHSGHKDHNHERDDTDRNKQLNTDHKISQDLDNNNSNEDILRSGAQEDNDDDTVSTDQKENEKDIDLINEKLEEKFFDDKNNYKGNYEEVDQDNIDYELDQTLKQTSHELTKDQQISFENYDILNQDSKDAEKQMNDQEPQNELVDQSSQDLSDVANSRRSYDDIKKAEIQTDINQNDLHSKLKNPTNNIEKAPHAKDSFNNNSNSTLRNSTKDVDVKLQTEDNNHQDLKSKESHQDNDGENHHHDYDSVEVRRYHHLPPRRYRARDLSHDWFSKSHSPSSKNRPMKQYTLSFFLRK